MKECMNCGAAIGRLETLHTWKSHVVCTACYQKLQAGDDLRSESFSENYIKCPMCHLKCPLGSSRCGACGHENPCDFVNAAYLGALETVKGLIRAGIEVNVRGGDDATALIMAPCGTYEYFQKCRNANSKNDDRVEMVRVLLDAGADPNAADKNGFTALHHAAMYGLRDAIILLIDRGAAVNVTDILGETPLQLAAEGGRLSSIEQLIRAGANLNLRNRDGLTALALARSKGHKEAASLLRENGGKRGTWWGT